MRLMRRTKQGLTAAAVLTLISGGGVAVLTQNVQNQIQNAVDGVADESEIEKQMRDIADWVLKETPVEDAKK